LTPREGLQSTARALGLGVLLGLLACSPAGPDAEPPAEGERPPNIVLIVLDTVRRDRLSLYGYERPTSPNLDALARSSRTFRRAYSTSSWTAPAHASLFTGLYPAAHGVTQRDWRLDESLTTLAELLAGRGYETLAVVSNAMLSAEWGFAQGFERYLDAWQTSRERFANNRLLAATRVDEVAADLLAELLAERRPERPLFLFVNLIGPHSPYNSCGAHCGRFVSDASVKRQGFGLAEHYRRPEPFSPEEIQHLSELYDAEVTKVDEILGRIVETLRSRGVLDDALLVVTSDHGEAFGEGGHLGHRFNVREVTTAVPLLLHRPALFAPGSVDDLPAQLTDVFSTALRVAGLDPAEYAAQGVDLEHTEARRGRPVLLEYYTPDQALRLALGDQNRQVRVAACGLPAKDEGLEHQFVLVG